MGTLATVTHHIPQQTRKETKKINIDMDLFGSVVRMSKGKCKASKVCTCCKERKPLWMFSKDRRLKDGLRIICKECDKVIQRQSRDKMTYITIEYKQCSDCGQIKPIDQFGLDNTKKDGHRSYCLECLRIRSKRTRQNEKEGLRRRDGDAHFKSKK